MESKGKAFWSGVLGVIPLLVGVIPFGLIYGALARSSGLSTLSAQAMSSIVFAGSAQFITTSLVRDAAPGVIIVLTIAAVNLRHMLYSASVAPYLQHLPARWKALLAYLLTDEAYAVVINHYENAGRSPFSHWYFLGAGLALWTTWQLCSAAGIFLGASLRTPFSLDFALPLTFIGILVPALRSRPMLAAALAAGLIALLTNGLPYKLGLILAAVVGIMVGLLLERKP